MEQTVSDLIDLTDLRPETTPNAVGHQGDGELSDTGNSAVNNERTYVRQEGVESTASTTQLGVGMAAAAVDHVNGDPSNIGHITGETKLLTGGIALCLCIYRSASLPSLTSSCIKCKAMLSWSLSPVTFQLPSATLQ